MPPPSWRPCPPPTRWTSDRRQHDRPYGHDDRVCGYAALRALLDIEYAGQDGRVLLADKEEIGSMGVTGMQSAAFDAFMTDLCDGQACR